MYFNGSPDNMKFEELIGKTLTKVEHSKDEFGKEQIVFTDQIADCYGDQYKLCHDQDCCEDVYVESIVGDLDDLVGTPILKASKDSHEGQLSKHDSNCPPPLEDSDDSYTWTFYNIATIKGTVTIRWYGTSNGYYSESVDFQRIRKYRPIRLNESEEEGVLRELVLLFEHGDYLDSWSVAGKAKEFLQHVLSRLRMEGNVTDEWLHGGRKRWKDEDTQKYSSPVIYL